MRNNILTLLVVALATISCDHRSATTFLSAQDFDTTVNGQQIALYNLTNSNGMTAQITNYGGRVAALWVPDRKGELRDVVLGFGTVAEYLSDKAGNHGAVVGRFANRIDDRKFTLDGTEYLLAGNPDAQIAPGGTTDFNRALFVPRPFTNEKGEQALELKYRSPDGEAGFPGNVDVTVVYTLTEDNALRIDYTATTDKPTVVSLTNHCFFNLRGGADDVLGYDLEIDADYYLPVKAGNVPTGEIASVTGTPMDFRAPRKIGARIDDDFEPLTIGEGYDHCYVLNIDNGALTPVATVTDSVSGIVLEVATDQPGMQLYTGNKLNGLPGKRGQVYGKRGGLCLETMHFPDSPNHDNFPSPVLRPGETYRQSCIYRFGTV